MNTKTKHFITRLKRLPLQTKYGKMMRKRAWKWEDIPLSLNITNISDGQHRLLAVMKTDKEYRYNGRPFTTIKTIKR